MTDKEQHILEREYALTKEELLDAISRRFRAKVTLEGAVAEVHLGKAIKLLKRRGLITDYKVHDEDGVPDYSIWLPAFPKKEIRVECKNIRNSNEAYRKGGQIYAYKVETQKTRTSKSDPTSRFYSFSQFEILAVCLGKKTHDWKQFMFIRSNRLAKHKKHKKKMAVMHPVPLPTTTVTPPWYVSLKELIESWGNK